MVEDLVEERLVVGRLQVEVERIRRRRQADGDAALVQVPQQSLCAYVNNTR